MHDNDYSSHRSPYEEGKTLTLSVIEGVPPNKHTIKAQILRPIQPSTLSCVMEVDVLAVSGSTKPAKRSILKLYDWRYAAQLRQDYGVDDWGLHHEDIYRTFVEDGGAKKFISALDDHKSVDDQLCEVEAYNRLKDLQGRHVPRFFADVRLDAFTTPNAFFEVRGILLEFVSGYSLTDLAKYAPQSSWQRICDETVRIVNLISDHGILNEDVKPRNVLIRTGGKFSKCEVVVIDFGQCRFRATGQSEADWKHEKWRQDEEGAIGYVMAHKLNGAFEYRRSYCFRCICTECRDLPLIEAVDTQRKAILEF